VNQKNVRCVAYADVCVQWLANLSKAALQASHDQVIVRCTILELAGLAHQYPPMRCEIQPDVY